jgi:hypothetical protein
MRVRGGEGREENKERKQIARTLKRRGKLKAVIS